jgi:hypothetical protein
VLLYRIIKNIGVFFSFSTWEQAVPHIRTVPAEEAEQRLLLPGGGVVQGPVPALPQHRLHGQAGPPQVDGCRRAGGSRDGGRRVGGGRDGGRRAVGGGRQLTAAHNELVHGESRAHLKQHLPPL